MNGTSGRKSSTRDPICLSEADVAREGWRITTPCAFIDRRTHRLAGRRRTIAARLTMLLLRALHRDFDLRDLGANLIEQTSIEAHLIALTVDRLVEHRLDPIEELHGRASLRIGDADSRWSHRRRLR